MCTQRYTPREREREGVPLKPRRQRQSRQLSRRINSTGRLANLITHAIFFGRARAYSICILLFRDLREPPPRELMKTDANPIRTRFHYTVARARLFASRLTATTTRNRGNYDGSKERGKESRRNNVNTIISIYFERGGCGREREKQVRRREKKAK